MAEAAVRFLLENLRVVVDEHIDLIRGVKREVKKLLKEFEQLKPLLRNLQECPDLDREIRGLVYRAEDIIDTVLTRPVAKSLPRFLPKNWYPDFGHRSTTISDLETLTNDVRKAVTKAADAEIRKAVTKAPDAQKQQLHGITYQKVPRLERNNVVGFEDELYTTLGKYLCGNKTKLDVISIVGDYGSGKTTLASEIYEHPSIERIFPTLFWVTVSQEFSIKSLFLAVIKDVDEKTIAQLTDSMLADIVRHKLAEENFLMIVDGVHTTQDWMAIEAALPKANGVGKVVVTTHDEKLACRANPKGNNLRLRPLNREESWKLFQLKVFGKLEECPSDLENIGKNIANKCEGSRLAIVTMARELGTTREIGEWKKISKSVDMYLRKNREESMGNIIRMSYDKLPYHLKDCFLYLGMFPEDTEIPAWKLVNLWIAEGFIKRNPRKRLEEAAEDQLEDLIDRNLVMVDKTKVGGGVKTCRISKMVRELICRMQAELSAEEKIFQEVHDVSEISTFRRLCINSNVVDFLRKKPYGANVRSFFCFSKESTDLPPECTESIPQAFSLLRILDASPIKFLEFPDNILYKLIHLRYIAISGEELNSLPQSVSNLWNLQTIIVTTASRTLTFEGNIWKMMRLRHLKTKAAIVISQVAKGKAGENLQTFTRLAAQCVTEDFCSRASNLKILGIRGELNMLLERNCLARLDRLQKLKLVHDVYPREAYEKPLIGLPPREAFPPNLMILELSSTFLEWNHMATLALLPTLEVLKLKENAFVGQVWSADSGDFPYLEVLLISSTDLHTWTASSDSFPKLRSLVLKNCECLDEIPHNLVKTLQVLDIDRCAESLVDSAKRIRGEKQQRKDLPRDGFKDIDRCAESLVYSAKRIGEEKQQRKDQPRDGFKDIDRCAESLVYSAKRIGEEKQQRKDLPRDGFKDIDRCAESLVYSAKTIGEEKQQMKDLPRDGFKLTISE